MREISREGENRITHWLVRLFSLWDDCVRKWATKRDFFPGFCRNILKVSVFSPERKKDIFQLKGAISAKLSCHIGIPWPKMVLSKIIFLSYLKQRDIVGSAAAFYPILKEPVGEEG